MKVARGVVSARKSGRVRLGLDASMLGEQRTGVGNNIYNTLQRLRALDLPIEYFLFSDRAVAAECGGLGRVFEFVRPGIKVGPVWMSLSLPGLLRQNEIDVFWGGNGFLPVQELRGTAKVVTIHDLTYRMAPGTMTRANRLKKLMFQGAAARGADAVVAISQSTANEVRTAYDREVDLILHPPIDPAFRLVDDAAVELVRRKYNLSDRFLFCLGTLEPRKNLGALVSAYERARAERPDTPQLVIGGGQGWLEASFGPRLQALVQKGWARTLGFVAQEDLPALYRACSLFVFVPVYEGYGMPVREALLCGAPVLASDIASVREAGGAVATYVALSIDAIADALRAWDQIHPPEPEKAAALSHFGSIEDFAGLLLKVASEVRNNRKRTGRGG